MFSFTVVAGHASPINYSFTGTGTGSIDSTSFTNSSFEVSINGNTANVMVQPSLGGALGILNLPGTIEIAGIGLLTFSDPLFVFGGIPNDEIGFGEFFQGNLIVISASGSGLATYDLKSDFGPVTGTNLFLNQFHGVTTNQGELTFTAMSPATFVADLSPVTSIPEPSHLLLLGFGLLWLWGLRRRFK
jgi:hypothetical protein